MQIWARLAGMTVMCLLLVVFCWCPLAWGWVALLTPSFPLWLVLGVLCVLLLPAFVWLSVRILRKVGLLHGLQVRPVQLIVGITFFALACVMAPGWLLWAEYGFTLPVTPHAYRYDTCALRNGVESASDSAPFTCTEPNGTLLSQP